MINFIQNSLIDLLKLNTQLAEPISIAILSICILFFAWMGNHIAKTYLVKLLRMILSKAHSNWAEVAVKYKAIQKISHFIPAAIIHLCLGLFSSEAISYSDKLIFLIQSAISIYVLLNIAIVVDALAATFEDIYNTFEVSVKKPIKSYLQVLRIVVYGIVALCVLATLLNTSPWKFLTGLGAATAIIILVFKDSILGFVASIQLASYDMIRIGDWVELPTYGADGDVTEISLGTIKVQNFDKTVSTIPTAALLNTGVKNWRGMQESGGRRIKRAINLDINSVKFLSQDEITKLEDIEFLKSHITSKRQEISEEQNGQLEKDNIPANGRRLTNIGLYRAYISEYLKNHKNIFGPGEGFTFLIRQLKPSDMGLPIELYVFTKTINWVEYEAIQADVFDHLLAAMPLFALKPFQGLNIKA